jgi:DNA-binding NarL/FixJ family response regulator
VKNLIVINNPKSPFDALKSSLKPYQRTHKASTLKKLPFEGSGLIVLIYANSAITDQLELLKSIKNKWSKINVILSGKALNSEEIILLFRGGLADYLTEPVDANDLKEALLRINKIQEEAAFNPSKFNLTNREFEVCQLLVEGLNGKEAAEYLDITPATIKVHKARVMQKLRVKNLPALVRMVGY